MEVSVALEHVELPMGRDDTTLNTEDTKFHGLLSFFRFDVTNLF